MGSTVLKMFGEFKIKITLLPGIKVDTVEKTIVHASVHIRPRR